MSTRMTFGTRIKELREEKGLSMQALAQMIDVSNAAICKWENQTTEPKLTYVLRLAEFFECSADYLIGRTDDFGGISPTDSLTKEERELLDGFRGLPSERKRLAVATMKLWKNT